MTVSRHFFGYSYGSEQDLEAIPEGLATPEGIGLGTTVEFLRAAYTDVVIEAGEEGLFAPNFFVDDQPQRPTHRRADDDLVTVIIGGDPAAWVCECLARLAPRPGLGADRQQRRRPGCGASLPIATGRCAVDLLVAAIVVAQLTALAQAVVGTVLMARYDLEPARLHALYGFSAVFAVGILYSYRTSTFMRGKEYLLYAGGCLFIMGLGLRELALN